MSDPVQININFDKIRNLAMRGVRRSYIFMGLATNARTSDPPLSHVLAERQRVILVPDDVPADVARHFREEFQEWAISNALRDLIETFSIFLTELHSYNRLALGQLAGNEFLNARQQFDRLAIREKFQEAAALVNMADQNGPAIFESWRKARNCLAHRMGRVSRADCVEGLEVLALQWMALQIEGVEPDGNVVRFDLNEGPITFENGADVRVRWELQTLEVALGHMLRPTRLQLSQMCHTAMYFTDRFMAATDRALEAAGVPRVPAPAPV